MTGYAQIPTALEVALAVVAAAIRKLTSRHVGSSPHYEQGRRPKPRLGPGHMANWSASRHSDAPAQVKQFCYRHYFSSGFSPMDLRPGVLTIKGLKGPVEMTDAKKNQLHAWRLSSSCSGDAYRKSNTRRALAFPVSTSSNASFTCSSFRTSVITLVFPAA
jgi:hypothetical protein